MHKEKKNTYYRFSAEILQTWESGITYSSAKTKIPTKNSLVIKVIIQNDMGVEIITTVPVM